MARTLAVKRVMTRDFGTCLSFDGSTSKVVLTQTSGLPLYNSSAFTITGWFKGVSLPNDGTTHNFYGEGSSSSNNPQYTLGLQKTAGVTKVNFFVRDDSNVTIANAIKSTTAISEGLWYHFTFIDNNGTCSLYINGTLDATNFNYTRGTLTIDRSAIGALQRAALANVFFGFLDESVLFTRALTAAEAVKLYTTGTSSVSSTSRVGWYKFDEGSGTTATDSSGNGNTGTITAATYSTSVVSKPRTLATNRVLIRDFGTCLSFVNATDKVQVTASSSLDLIDNKVTFSAWIKPLGATPNNAGRIFEKNSAYNFLLNASSSFTIGIGAGTFTSNTNVLKLGVWQHILAVCDGTTANMYVNGVLAGSGALASALVINGQNLFIGNNGGLTRNFNGLVDEVAIYNTNLSTTQIANLVFNGKYPSSGLAAFYKLDETSGTTANDSSGNSNTGTITGATYSTAVMSKPRTLAV